MVSSFKLVKKLRKTVSSVIIFMLITSVNIAFFTENSIADEQDLDTDDNIILINETANETIDITQNTTIVNETINNNQNENDVNESIGNPQNSTTSDQNESLNPG